MAEEKNYFKELFAVDLSDEVREKNKLSYVPWAVAWGKLKSIYPDAEYYVYETTNPEGYVCNYFTDGRTCWVKVSVTVKGIEHVEDLAVMDFRNAAIPYDKVTSCDVVKTIQRALTKACARHGVGLYVYKGEDLPDEIKESDDLRGKIMDLMKAKAKVSEKAKKEVLDLLNKYAVDGDLSTIESVEDLKELKKAVMAVRK